ncbi:ATP-dependent RecD-like DNA helicase, partial [Staphylococcus haemolyticus]
SYVIDPTQEMLNDGTDVTIARETLEEMILQLSEEKKLILSDEQVSIPSLYYSELKSVQNLYRIKTNTTKLKEIEQSDLQMHIGEI